MDVHPIRIDNNRFWPTPKSASQHNLWRVSGTWPRDSHRSCIFQAPVIAFAVEFLHTDWAKSSRLPLKSSRNPAGPSRGHLQSTQYRSESIVRTTKTRRILVTLINYSIIIMNKNQQCINIQHHPKWSKKSVVSCSCWQPAQPGRPKTPRVLCSRSSPPTRPSRQWHAVHHRWARPCAARPAAAGRKRSPAVSQAAETCWNYMGLSGKNMRIAPTLPFDKENCDQRQLDFSLNCWDGTVYGKPM